MAKSKEEAIFVQVGEEIIELKGAEKDAFIVDQTLRQAEAEQIEVNQQAQKELKKSAYTKLGLTKEEIDAIL